MPAQKAAISGACRTKDEKCSRSEAKLGSISNPGKCVDQNCARRKTKLSHQRLHDLKGADATNFDLRHGMGKKIVVTP